MMLRWISEVPPAIVLLKLRRYWIDHGGAPAASSYAACRSHSIAWIGSLSWNGFDNNVSTMTRNVLRCFLDTKPHEPFKAPA